MLSVTFADLRNMPEAERNERLGSLADAAHGQPNGELSQIDDEIRALAEQVGVPAEDVRERVRQGVLRESLEVCRLLMLVDLRERVVGYMARAH